MEALVKVNGGVRVNVNGRWSGSMGILNNGGSMGAFKKKGQRGRWSRSMKHGEGSGQTGLGFGSDRGVAVGQTGVWPRVRQEVVLQGCKLYLAGL